MGLRCSRHSARPELKFRLDGEPSLGGIGGEPLRIVTGKFTDQRDVFSNGHADHRIPFAAISDVQPGRPEIMVDQPENRSLKRPVTT